MNILRSLIIVYRNIKIREHLTYLEKVATFGDGFCKSPFYKEGKAQLLQVKINNASKIKSRVKFGTCCYVSTNIFLNEKGSITVGDYVYMNFVTMRIDHHLTIGSHCLFWGNVKLWDTKNHRLNPKERHDQCEYIAHSGSIDSYAAGGGDMIIGDDV